MEAAGRRACEMAEWIGEYGCDRMSLQMQYAFLTLGIALICRRFVKGLCV